MTDNFPNGLPAGIQILNGVKIDPDAPENFYFHHIDYKPTMYASLQNGTVILCQTPEQRDALIAQHQKGVAPSKQVSAEVKAASRSYAAKWGAPSVDLPEGISML
jgi:hypothetical protein